MFCERQRASLQLCVFPVRELIKKMSVVLSAGYHDRVVKVFAHLCDALNAIGIDAKRSG